VTSVHGYEQDKALVGS